MEKSSIELNGKIIRILSERKEKNEESKVFVLSYRQGKKQLQITCLGVCPYGVGSLVSVFGHFFVHATYGQQFSVDSVTHGFPEENESIRQYLIDNIKGIGNFTAKRLVNRFGEKTFEKLEEHPEEISKLWGISSKKATEFQVQMWEKRQERRKTMYLLQHGINGSMLYRIINRYDEEKIRKIFEEDPYQMIEDIEGMTFEKADEIAQKEGIGENSVSRICAGIRYVETLYEASGHTGFKKESLIKRTVSLLGFSEIKCTQIIEEMVLQEKLHQIGDVVYFDVGYRKESQIAEKLSKLCKQDKKDLLNDFEETIGKIQEETKIILDPTQKEAVYQVVQNGFSTVTGGPGTGKTTTVKTIVSYFVKKKKTIVMAAPTGKAAKRMTESVGDAANGEEATTLHRLLEVIPKENSGFSFKKNAENPIKADVVVVDECSMLDIPITLALLNALKEGTQLVFVGDTDQLPSVGTGAILKDIINSNTFPCVRLTKIFRQKGESLIIDNAYKINSGHRLNYRHPHKTFNFVRADSVETARHKLVFMLRTWFPDHIEGATPMNVQVLCPQRKGPLGVDALNVFLQNVLNPYVEGKQEAHFRGNVFREGDKVIQMKNCYKMVYKLPVNGQMTEGIGVFNGDTGFVTRIADDIVTVTLDDGKIVEYREEDLDKLSLAYALTIHKSQGSEYPAILIPAMKMGVKTLYTRNLLYTGVTRAKASCCLVGKENVFDEMLLNSDSNHRYTSLQYHIQIQNVPNNMEMEKDFWNDFQII